MERPNIDGIDPDIQCYIYYLECIVNAHPKLQREISKTLDVIADDLALLNRGEKDGFKILTGFKDDKLFDRIMVVLKMKNDLKGAALSQIETDTPVKRKITKMQDITLNGK
jgi:hypothetical protein